MRRLWRQKRYMRWFITYLFMFPIPITLLIPVINLAYLPIERQPEGIFGAFALVILAYASYRFAASSVPGH